MKRVAVIGGGAAGISTAKNLLSSPSLSVTLFEASPSLGGTWDVSNPLSSLYSHLRTNLPARVMEYPDYPFHFEGEEKSSFPSWREVRDYLRDYATWGGVNEVVRFGEVVTDVRWDEEQGKWQVSSVAAKEGEGGKGKEDNEGKGGKEESSSSSSSLSPTTEQFDSVVVCNGHYSLPSLPNIPGLSSFSSHPTNQVLHSHSYFTPDPFVNKKKIVVLGGGASGVDISLDLAIHLPSTEVILSHRMCPSPSSSSPSPSPSPSPSGSSLEAGGSTADGGASGLLLYPSRTPNLTQLPPLLSIDPTTFSFSFGREGEEGKEAVEEAVVEGVDALLFCTGYQYSFPFLSSLMGKEEGGEGEEEEEGLRVKNGNVGPLYKHLFYIPRPSLCFVGLPWRVCPFPLFHHQTSLLASVLSSPSFYSSPPSLPTLPSREEMERDLKDDLEKREREGLKGRYAHMLGGKQWGYFQELIDLKRKVDGKGEEGEEEKRERVRKKMYEDSGFRRRKDPLTYRGVVYTEEEGEEITAREVDNRLSVEGTITIT